jgi:hypothetical protein
MKCSLFTILFFALKSARFMDEHAYKTIHGFSMGDG